MFHDEIILTKDHALDVAATLADLATEAVRLGTDRYDVVGHAHTLVELIEQVLSAELPGLDA